MSKKYTGQKLQPKTQAKLTAFLTDLVALAGSDGGIVTNKQITDLYKSDKTKYPHFVLITMNPAYKVGRNQFVATLDSNPASVRDKTMANMVKLEAKKESVMLPKATRNSAKALLKAISAEVAKQPKVKSKAVKPAKETKFSEPNDMVGFENEEENINSLLRTIA